MIGSRPTKCSNMAMDTKRFIVKGKVIQHLDIVILHHSYSATKQPVHISKYTYTAAEYS